MRIVELTSSDIKYYSKQPNTIPRETVAQIIKLITTGNEVPSAMIGRNVLAAQQIMYAVDGEDVIGALVIKNPVTSYKTSVFAKAGVPKLETQYTAEMGYAIVNPGYRGQRIMRKLAEPIATWPTKIFATTRENNTAINSLLNSIGFKQIGKPFTSNRGDYNILLWGTK